MRKKNTHLKSHFDWPGHTLATARRVARKAKVGTWSDVELVALEFVAALPDVVAGGCGERSGYVVKPSRPDVEDIVFDSGNNRMAAFWTAYAQRPEQTLKLLLKMREERQRNGRATDALKHAAGAHGHEKAETQLRIASRVLKRPIPSLRTQRRKLIRESNRAARAAEHAHRGLNLPT